MNGINTTKDQFLASIESLQTRQSRVQNQITSGYRISKPSDDPTVVSDVLSLTAEIRRTVQIKSNLSRVKSETDAAESSLQSAVQLLQDGATLAVQGANSLTTPSQRNILAQQVQGLLEQMVSLSQTRVDGQLVFGGDASAPTYQVNLQNPNGVERLAQTASTRQIQDSTGVAFSASESAQSIFDRRNPDDSLAGDNVFAALNQLRTSLVANDQQGIAQAGNSIQQAQTWMNGKLGFYGAVQNRIRTATDIADSYQTHEEAALSQLRDTDVAAAALESTQVQANLTAAMASQARMPFTSLFDYLK